MACIRKNLNWNLRSMHFSITDLNPAFERETYFLCSVCNLSLLVPTHSHSVWCRLGKQVRALLGRFIRAFILTSPTAPKTDVHTRVCSIMAHQPRLHTCLPCCGHGYILLQRNSNRWPKVSFFFEYRIEIWYGEMHAGRDIYLAVEFLISYHFL